MSGSISDLAVSCTRHDDATIAGRTYHRDRPGDRQKRLEMRTRDRCLKQCGERFGVAIDLVRL